MSGTLYKDSATQWIHDKWDIVKNRLFISPERRTQRSMDQIKSTLYGLKIRTSSHFEENAKVFVLLDTRRTAAFFSKVSPTRWCQLGVLLFNPVLTLISYHWSPEEQSLLRLFCNPPQRPSQVQGCAWHYWSISKKFRGFPQPLCRFKYSTEWLIKLMDVLLLLSPDY